MRRSLVLTTDERQHAGGPQCNSDAASEQQSRVVASGEHDPIICTLTCELPSYHVLRDWGSVMKIGGLIYAQARLVFKDGNAPMRSDHLRGMAPSIYSVCLSERATKPYPLWTFGGSVLMHVL